MLDRNSKLPFTIGAKSDRGRKRRRNEDYFSVFEPENEALTESRGVLAVLADGMGGHFSGGEASRMAVEVMGEIYFKAAENAAKALASAFIAANNEVFAKVGDGKNGVAGTTLTAVALFPDEFIIAHAGDSRVYLARPGRMDQLTKDHSLVGEMMHKGLLGREEARNHPKRNIITRAVGLRENVEPDIDGPMPFLRGDRILVCSDGLSSMLSDGEIAGILLGKDPAAACKALVDMANEKGGDDNTTVIVAMRD